MHQTDNIEKHVKPELLDSESQSKLPWNNPELKVLDINIVTEAQVGSGPQLIG